MILGKVFCCGFQNKKLNWILFDFGIRTSESINEFLHGIHIVF